MQRLVARTFARTFALACALACAPAAAQVDQLVGTWECRVPGAAPTRTPPIVWFGAARADGKAIESAVDLDGFARQVSGISDLASQPDGWMRVQPQDGPAFAVKPHGPVNKRGLLAMSLKRGGASYRCLRLPAIA